MQNFFIFSLVFTPMVIVQADIQTNFFGGVLELFNLISSLDNSEDVNFSLYTPNSSKLQMTKVEAEDVGNVAPFKFLVHGFKESPTRPYFDVMRYAYFQRGNYNVVYVNWSLPASGDYKSAVRNSYKTGIILGKFIIDLCDVSSTTLDDIHLLGHSLGSHVVGVAGKEVFKRTGSKIGRITGLDPAGPLFEGFLDDGSRRLDREDAKMVDIVHTDAGFFGYKTPIGTVDFFPNGGTAFQPGCTFITRTSATELFEMAREYVFCSHTRSYVYYIDSINSKDMLAVKCDSWENFQMNACEENEMIPFGEDAPLGASGEYYFRTGPHVLKTL